MRAALAAFAAFVLSLLITCSGRPVAATRVLVTRHPAPPVWLGVTAALVVQSAAAIAVGNQLAHLPRQPVAVTGAVLFAVTALLLPRGARHADTTLAERERAYADRVVGGQGGYRSTLASFALVAGAAEWGNLSQLLLIGMVAGGGSALPVLTGSGLAFVTVTGLVVFHGDRLVRRARLVLVRYLAAGCCGVLAAVGLLTVLG